MQTIVKHVAFRFCFIYFGLFCVLSQALQGFVPLVDMYPLGTYPPMSSAVSWLALHLFGIHEPLVFVGSGSGDKVSDWVLQFLILIIAIGGAAIWSVLDRKRTNYDALAKWFALFVRFALAGQLISYGLVKLIPEQMPFPSLKTLVEPYGDFSPMGVLWASIGASRGYENFAGAAELLGGILLIFPRTALLGALVAAADMAQVFALNMTYDVPVKLLSFHLLLLSLYLLAPEARRLVDFLILNRSVAPSAPAQLFQAPRANMIALAAQIVFGLYLVGTNLFGVLGEWTSYGDGSPESPLYGIWNVEMLSIDGHERPPLLNDPERFRRVIFGHPQSVAFQRMDDSFASYTANISEVKKSIALVDASDKTSKARYTFKRIGSQRLVLDGVAGKHHLRMDLALVDRSKFLLVSRGFNWVQDYPFHR